MDRSPPGSSVHGISQARILEWESVSRTEGARSGRGPVGGEGAEGSGALQPLKIKKKKKNTGVGCHFLLQGIFLTQGSNLCLLNWQADSLSLSH